jgi:stage II sporulation protein R
MKVVFGVFRLNVVEKSIIFGFIFTILVSFTNFVARCERISEKVLRLHVLANSNSESDQLLKEQVRNRIIRHLQNTGYEFKNLKDTKQFLEGDLTSIINESRDEINLHGLDYHVDAQITKSSFGTRIYNGVVMPAGNYETVKVTIGSGKGKNFWCVIFPPMCLPAAQSELDVLPLALDETECEIVGNGSKYKIEFKSIEFLQNFRVEIRKILDKAEKIRKNLDAFFKNLEYTPIHESEEYNFYYDSEEDLKEAEMDF